MQLNDLKFEEERILFFNDVHHLVYSIFVLVLTANSPNTLSYHFWIFSLVIYKSNFQEISSNNFPMGRRVYAKHIYMRQGDSQQTAWWRQYFFNLYLFCSPRNSRCGAVWGLLIAGGPLDLGSFIEYLLRAGVILGSHCSLT